MHTNNPLQSSNQTIKTNLLKSTPLFNVLPAVLLLLMSLLLWSCEGEHHDHPPVPNPHSKVPDWVEGSWSAGKFSRGEFWSYDGTHVGNAIELGLAFDFKKVGNCKFYFVTGGTSFGCRTEAFVYEEGNVVFHDNNSFTFTPTEGNARGFYKGCASSYQNYNKKHTPKDLRPTTYYYTRDKDSQGNDKLIIRFKPDAENTTTFYRANW